MGKRIAFVDTEFGTNFYTQRVSERAIHPEPFDFDCLYSKSITEVTASVKGLDLTKYGVIIIDSITHLWDSCKNAFTGKLTKIGTISLNAWSQIKRPYRELTNLLLSLPVHVLICGRQGAEYGDDETTGELKHLGYKMRAEGETQYEPDILIRLESYKAGRKKDAVPVAVVEKDHTGILAGQLIEWPAFDNIAKPLVGLLGSEQVTILSDDEVGIQDADAVPSRSGSAVATSRSCCAALASVSRRVINSLLSAFRRRRDARARAGGEAGGQCAWRATAMMAEHDYLFTKEPNMSVRPPNARRNQTIRLTRAEAQPYA